ncbi:MAG: VCBS repeat-containing protein [bacterium]|nr:VCBS repeat-containing protein [bacterium]MDT8367416.1 VCBS repeat-containing protein [bacterium]
MRSVVFAIPFIFITLTSHGSGLELSSAPVPEALPTTPLLTGQIPHSKVARGSGAIAMAYLSSPTRRYAHGVLGDKIEAASLTLVLDDGKELRYDLPETRVFEDLQPRLVDLDGKEADEVVVVETDLDLGASLAVYGLHNGKVIKIAATPFIGHANRWLNPIGVGDFNGDSVMDVALVSTPHIGGILKFYSYTPPRLTSYAQMGGVSTHSIGSTALGMGKVVKGEIKDLILAPSQRHNELLLLEWMDGNIVESARVTLPANISSDLVPTGYNQWTFKLENGACFTVNAIP